MPWAPELFSAPALERLLAKRRRAELLAVPFFYGLTAGELDALIESFDEVERAAIGRFLEGVLAAYTRFQQD